MSFGFGVGDFIKVIELANSLRERFSNAPKQYNDVQKEVQNLSQFLDEIRESAPLQKLGDAQKDKLKANLQACQSLLEDLNKKLDKYEDLASVPKHDSSKGRGISSSFRRKWKRVQWEPNDIQELRLRIATNISNLSSFTILHLSSDTKDGIDRLHQRQDDEDRLRERRDFVEWLNCTDYASQHSDLENARQEGTGQWLLDSSEFRDWISQSNQTLFCPGIPGAGKTMLASLVISELGKKVQVEPKLGLAFLYFDYKRHNQQTLADLLSSLLVQLAMQPSGITDEAKALRQRHFGRNTRPSLNDITNTLHSIAQGFSRVFLVVDALDECEMSLCRPLLDALFHLQAKSQANFFATSRALPEIGVRFDGATSLEIRADEADVRRYLENKITQQRSPVLRKPGLQMDIVTQISAVIDGMFLLAKLHLDSLSDKTSAKAVKTALQNLPKGSKAIDIAYKAAIDRIELQPEGFRDLAKEVLRWIVYARRPLRVQELRYALAVEPDTSKLDEENLRETEDMVSACAGLVVIDKERGIIRLAHYTTQEFFERFRHSWIPDGESAIARACIACLSFDETLRGPAFYNEEVDDDEIDDEQSDDEEIDDLYERLEANPFLEYAAAEWGFHACEVDWTTLEQPALSFLQDEFKVSCAIAILFRDYSRRKGKSAKGASPIHLTAYFGLLEATTALLSSGLSPNITDGDRRTPLSWAAEDGHEALVRMLLERDDIQVDLGGDLVRQTPLSYAVKKGHDAIVRLLLRRSDISVNTRDEFDDTPLSLAAQRGHLAVVQQLLDRDDVDINTRDETGLTPLANAAFKGHEAVVRLLLERDDIDINTRDQTGSTPLANAAFKGHEAVVRLLLERDDIDINTRDQTGSTPLANAAFEGYEAVLRLLLERDDVDINIRDERGSTPLANAARWGHEAVVRLLLEQDDIAVNTKDYRSFTPLAHAAAEGYKAIIHLLLEREDVRAGLKDEGENESDDLDVRDTYSFEEWAPRDYGGLHPLYLAAWRGNLGTVQILLDQESARAAYAALENCNRQTPLFLAARNGHEAVVSFLLETVANVNAESETGQTALFQAARGGLTKMAQLLLDFGLQPDSKDKSGRTSLSWAVGPKKYWSETLEGNEAVVRLLLGQQNAEADLKDRTGRTPLSWVADAYSRREYNSEDDAALVRLLVERNDVDIDSKDDSGRTPLSWMAANASPAAALLLLERGAEVDSRNDGGRTPLSIAAEASRDKMAQLLLDYDAAADSRDKNGRTPLSWAASGRRPELVQLLLDQGVDADATDVHGRTPLSWAARKIEKRWWHRQEIVVRLLLERDDVDVNSKDKKGRTPLWWATEGVEPKEEHKRGEDKKPEINPAVVELLRSKS